MATNSAASDNTCDRSIIIIDDNLHYPPVIKEFFSSLCLDMEKNRWSSKCKICSISTTDTYKTTSNFLKHLKNKHQPMFDEWKKSNDQSAKDKNQLLYKLLVVPNTIAYVFEGLIFVLGLVLAGLVLVLEGWYSYSKNSVLAHLW
jgi:type IV secretory pathway VirB6-like protein